MRSPRQSAVGQRERAQTSTIGLVLVLAMVLGGTITVVAFGGIAITDTQHALSIERAEKSMTQLDSKAALVALGGTDVQQVSLTQRGDATYAIENQSGWMKVNYTDTSTASDTTVVNQTLGQLVYRNDQTAIAYQGGGVWKQSEGSAVMVSPPEFHYRNGTLTLPIVSLSGTGPVANGAVITNNRSRQAFPNPSQGNPMQDHRVRVYLQSDYYRAWGRYFEARTDGQVTYHDDANIVQITLVSPIGQQKVTSATASLSAGGTFTVLGAAKTACGAVSSIYTDSYDSSGTEDSYCDQANTAGGSPSDNGDVVYGGNVDISTGSGGDDFRGSLVSGASIDVGTGGGQPEISGHINYTTSCNPNDPTCQSRITGSGTVNQISGVSQASQVNGYLRSTIDEIEADNDNAAAADITGDQLDSGDVTLTAGNYYLENLEVAAGDTLTVDTTGGDVKVAIAGDLEVYGDNSDPGAIEVVGENDVKLFVEGKDSVDIDGDGYDLDLDGKNAAITTVNGGDETDNATQIRVYGQDNMTARLSSGTASAGNNVKFVGVIYAPPGSSGTGTVEIDGGEVYGGILTGTTTLNKGGIHYDEALQTTQVISRDASVIKVTYLHVTTNEINVTSR